MNHYRREHPKREAKPLDCQTCRDLSNDEVELAKHVEAEHSSEDFSTGNLLKFLTAFRIINFHLLVPKIRIFLI